MLAFVALGALIAYATPAPAAARPVSAAAKGSPAPPNPFNLDPVTPAPLASALPVIGTTRSRPVCSTIRRAVAPAVTAAMSNDRVYGGLRKRVFDYVASDSESARDLHLMQMDREVDGMVKYVDAIEQALKSPEFDVAATAKPEEAKMIRDLKTTLGGVLAAQKTQLNAMSGFVETERMRRFGTFDESQEAMRRATMPNVVGAPTPAPINGFLRDTQTTLGVAQHQVATGLNGAHLLDRDLGDISDMTGRYETAATKVIVPAANSCK